jgi:hypothetical protein
LFCGRRGGSRRIHLYRADMPIQQVYISLRLSSQDLLLILFIPHPISKSLIYYLFFSLAGPFLYYLSASVYNDRFFTTHKATPFQQSLVLPPQPAKMKFFAVLLLAASVSALAVAPRHHQGVPPSGTTTTATSANAAAKAAKASAKAAAKASTAAVAAASTAACPVAKRDPHHQSPKGGKS